LHEDISKTLCVFKGNFFFSLLVLNGKLYSLFGAKRFSVKGTFQSPFILYLKKPVTASDLRCSMDLLLELNCRARREIPDAGKQLWYLIKASTRTAFCHLPKLCRTHPYLPMTLLLKTNRGHFLSSNIDSRVKH